MMQNQNPSIPGQDKDTLVGTLRHSFRKMLLDTDGMLPAKIISFDRTTNLATVQPLITKLGTDGSQTPRAPIEGVPVAQWGGGGFLLNFNLNPGDKGWLGTNDRDISLFLKNFTQSKPGSLRIKKFSDGVFFPHQMTDYTIATEDNANVVLQSLDGTVKVALWADKVKIAAPTVEIDTETLTGTVSGTATITADEIDATATTSATITAPEVNVTSTTRVTITSPKVTILGAVELITEINVALNAIKTGSTVTGGPFTPGTIAAIDAAITAIATFIG